MEGPINRLVFDSNIGLALVVSLPFSGSVASALHSWHESRAELYVPSLWDYEVVSSLRRSIFRKVISEETALAGLDYLDQLSFNRIPSSPRLNRQALSWAKRLGQSKASDSVYVSVAETIKAHFYTADQRLANACRSLGVPWVHWIGEFH